MVVGLTSPEPGGEEGHRMGGLGRPFRKPDPNPGYSQRLQGRVGGPVRWPPGSAQCGRGFLTSMGCFNVRLRLLAHCALLVEQL